MFVLKWTARRSKECQHRKGKGKGTMVMVMVTSVAKVTAKERPFDTINCDMRFDKSLVSWLLRMLPINGTPVIVKELK